MKEYIIYWIITYVTMVPTTSEKDEYGFIKSQHWNREQHIDTMQKSFYNFNDSMHFFTKVNSKKEHLDELNHYYSTGELKELFTIHTDFKIDSIWIKQNDNINKLKERQ